MMGNETESVVTIFKINGLPIGPITEIQAASGVQQSMAIAFCIPVEIAMYGGISNKDFFTLVGWKHVARFDKSRQMVGRWLID